MKSFKVFIVTILGMLLSLVSLSSNAQGKKPKDATPNGSFVTIPVDFTAIAGNYTTLILTDEAGNTYAAYSSSGNVQNIRIPKHGKFLVMFYMESVEQAEINYQLKWDDTNYMIGITLQPGEYRGVGSYDIDLDKKSAFVFIRM